MSAWFGFGKDAIAAQADGVEYTMPLSGKPFQQGIVLSFLLLIAVCVALLLVIILVPGLLQLPLAIIAFAGDSAFTVLTVIVGRAVAVIFVLLNTVAVLWTRKKPILNRGVRFGFAFVLLPLILSAQGYLMLTNAARDLTGIRPQQSLSIAMSSSSAISAVTIVSAVCSDPPEPLANGGGQYPSFPSYQRLSKLGPIFTAAECGAQRQQQVVGDGNTDYILGSSINLKSEPKPQFRLVLESIGYQCTSDDCTRWELWKTVKVRELLRLKPYASQIISDDCLNCG